MADPICTEAEFRQYLSQLPEAPAPGGAEATAKILELLKRATQIIYTYIRFEFSGYTTATEKVVLGYGSNYLILGPHRVGSVVQILTDFGQEVPTTAWVEDQDGNVYLSNTSQAMGIPVLTGYGPALFTWLPGRYTVKADWGWPLPPDDIKEVCLEIAVNIWQESQKPAFSDAIGVEASGEVRVGYQRGLTNRQEMILKLYLQQYQDSLPVVIG